MYHSAQISLTDLCPIKHGTAKVSVGHKKTKLGHVGTVTVSEFSMQLAKQVSYTIKTDCDAYVMDVDAVAGAIALRKELIAANRIDSPLTHKK